MNAVSQPLLLARLLVLLGAQPDRPGPHALGAERQRGRDLPARADAAGAEHGYVGADRVHDVGRQHHRRHLAGVAAGLVALRDDDVDAVGDVAERVLGGAGQRGDLDAVLVALLDHVDRRRAERVGDQHRPVLERDVEVRAGHRVQPAEHPLAALALGQRRHARA